MFKDAIIAGIGFVAGAFTPSVGRKIKALFTSEATKIEAVAKTEIKKV